MESQGLAEVIKERRGALHLQQRDLAELSGVALRTIIQIEGGTGNPSLNTLHKLAQVLGLEIKLIVKN